MDATSEFNYFSLFKDLGNVCMSEGTCGDCKEHNCLTGYAKISVSKCYKSRESYVAEGYNNIPYSDLKGGYDEDYLLKGIAHLLHQCRSCDDNHYADCLLNVVRSCYEVIVFGESQPYNGSAFAYLMKLQEEHPERAAIILEEYKLKE